jgi:cbb3-type cytochrome oxidase cytochrome c subunit
MHNRWKKVISIIVVVLIAIFVVIQIIPLGKDHSNPAVVSEPKWDSQQTRDMAKTACFDCHSNETIWPWYTNIAPASWLVYYDVVDGRRRMNFSDWGNIHLREPGEIASVINEGEMPPFQYLLIHTSARLTPAEKTLLINGLLKTIGQ